MTYDDTALDPTSVVAFATSNNNLDESGRLEVVGWMGDVSM